MGQYYHNDYYNDYKGYEEPEKEEPERGGELL